MKHFKFFIVALGISLAIINSTKVNAKARQISGTCSGQGNCGVSNDGCVIEGAYFN